MKLVYFVSPHSDYASAIYPGVGPPLGRSLGWQVATIDSMADADCQVGVVDNRLTPADVDDIERFLSRPASRRFAIFFRVSDPDMPRSNNDCVRFIFRCRDLPGVHYASVYEPAGSLGEFFQSLSKSGVARLPFAYERHREIERDIYKRQRRIFFSGAREARLYPLRAEVERQRNNNPLLRIAISDLPHPGYPESGRPSKHAIIGDAYIQHAARFSHFFLSPSRYGCELMKYVECAYAGSAPIGRPAISLPAHVADCFFPYSGNATELLRAIASNRKEIKQRAERYREAMRELRDPQKINSEFIDQIRPLL